MQRLNTSLFWVFFWAIMGRMGLLEGLVEKGPKNGRNLAIEIYRMFRPEIQTKCILPSYLLAHGSSIPVSELNAKFKWCVII